MSLNQISPEKFTWDKYLSQVNVSLHQLLSNADPEAVVFYFNKPRLAPGVTLIGYAPANRILIRNRPTGYVLMVEFEGEEVWFHVGNLPEEPTKDKYGNPLDGSSLPNCCYPDCGCASSRLCMAENGPNSCAMTLNREPKQKL